MTQEELHKISILTKVFHPYFGEGFPIIITLSTITIKFESGEELRFVSNKAGTSDLRFIGELYLKPIKIVEV